MLGNNYMNKFFYECPIGCICGKAIKDNSGVFIDFYIENVNKEITNTIDIGNINNKSIKEVIPGVIEKELKIDKEDNDTFLEILDGWYNIKIIELDEDRYILCFIENKEKKTKVVYKQDCALSKTRQNTIERTSLESISNLSHDLRTPLNLIFSSIQVVDKGYYIINKNTKKIDHKYLGIIRQNGYRLLKLVDNIIDSSKMSCGILDFEPTNYDIVSFVEDICQSVNDFAKQNSMNIVFDTEIEEKIIGFDLYKMERVILNLLSNALKFNKKDGNIEIAIKENNSMIEINIKDEGIGIPNNEIECVFERFKQVKRTDFNEKTGSGIGLALVKSLVELHNGNIEVKSELDKGSEFIVKIPNITYDVKLKTINKNKLKNNFVQKIEVEFSDIYL